MSDENKKKPAAERLPQNYGRPAPPTKHKWRKGVSGNPKGRPSKEASLTALLKEEIEKICPADKQGRTWRELIVLAAMQMVLKGSAVALKEIWDRVDGKLTLSLDHTAAVKQQVSIKVVYEDGLDPNDVKSSKKDG